VLETELAAGILFQDPYPTEAYIDTMIEVPTRFVNLNYLAANPLPVG
jgi:hypothetical protein